MTSTASAILHGHYQQDNDDSCPSSPRLQSTAAGGTTPPHCASRRLSVRTVHAPATQKKNTSTRFGEVNVQKGPGCSATCGSRRESTGKSENHHGKVVPCGKPTSRRKAMQRAAKQQGVPDGMTAANPGSGMSASALLASSPPPTNATFCYTEMYPLSRLPFASLRPNSSAVKTFEQTYPLATSESGTFRISG